MSAGWVLAAVLFVTVELLEARAFRRLKTCNRLLTEDNEALRRKVDQLTGSNP